MPMSKNNLTRLLFLYTDKDNEFILASKILSMDEYRFSIFIMTIHILFVMDITNMEMNGDFYNYITGTLRHIINNTHIKELLINTNNIMISDRQNMIILLRDFSHFFSLFIN